MGASNSDTWFKWTTVRGFGSIKYFNISYVVLAAVPLLHELSQREIPALAEFKDFPETLKFAYLASLLFAVAIALYQYGCPPEIKRFGNPDEFLAAHYDIYLRSHPDRRAGIVLAQLDPAIDANTIKKITALVAAVGQGTGGHAAQHELDQLVGAHLPDAVQRHLLRTYHANNQRRPWLSGACLVLYIAGTLILVGLLAKRSCNLFL